MRRYVPFAIIALVGLLTVGVATAVYRAKMHRPKPPVSASAASPSPGISPSAVPAEAKEDENIHARGPQNAPVTMEVYGDFQCPSCAIATGMIDELEKEYSGKLRVIFRQFPLAMHQHAVKAAMAAEAAGLQGHFWEMHDMLYKNQPVWSKASDPSAFFGAYAESLGLDGGQFALDAKSPEVQARIISEGDAGVARGVKNTPTIFVDGVEVLNAFRREVLQQAIEGALAQKKKG
ncbi:MAG: thioredoxin domain-containing protein [Chthoniobacterales bacterium]|nr:thioredoxin domain-containing protein [Chthoniobacterales bacterium]